MTKDMLLLFVRFLFPLIFWAAAWILMLIAGRPLLDWLKNLKGMRWSPRENTPDSHLQKAGTPSMGGIAIIGSALAAQIAILLVAYLLSLFTSHNSAPSPHSSPIWQELVGLSFPSLVVALHCALGWRDDWLKARGQGGLLARYKLLGQIVLAIGFVLSLKLMRFPLALSWSDPREWMYTDGASGLLLLALCVLVVLVLIASSNAVNLTDGIDGLAAGLAFQVGLALFVTFQLLTSQTSHMNVFSIPINPFVTALPAASILLWLCLSGACFGFLAFNKNPAKMFMGDTGSLALGAALGVNAVLTRSVFLLPFIGFIFWVEMFSVMAQVGYFKITRKISGEGRRIFKRAPLHHHFELAGWSEWKVVGTFWAINLVATIVGLALWKMGILPRFP